ncbi:MAG: sorbosone dehydrogenase family protein [Candidatus Bipolaricaulia bacterium]
MSSVRTLCIAVLLVGVLTGCGTELAAQVDDPCDVVTPSVAQPEIELVQTTDGLDTPAYLTHAGDGSDRLFVVDQPGVIRVLANEQLRSTPFLDIRDRVSFGGERGLLSVAFHPRFAETGRLYVNYTRASDGATVVAEYHVNDDGSRVDPDSERVLLTVDQPFSNHNGGQLQFGPDGDLYVGMGDGGAGGDPRDNGQDLSTLLGALLRIDVEPQNGQPYGIPSDNPFVGQADARDEIFAYGLRNPWRFSFDRCTGDLFLADVGQNDWEEVDLIEAGGNYGWNVMEGNHCFRTADCDETGLERPIAEYSHSQGCSITGGYVYRGSDVPDLVGHYLFADFCSGRIWSTFPTESGEWTMNQLMDTDLRISSFAEGPDGELYVIDIGGGVYQVTRP